MIVHFSAEKCEDRFMRRIVLCLILIWTFAAGAQAKKGGRTPAQDDYRFAPPPPPPLDPPEYDELEDEEFDDGFVPPPPPVIAPVPMNNVPPPPSQPPPPPADFRSSNNAYMSSGPGKFRFQVVEGEFYQKGKKRGRGKKRLVGENGAGN